MSIMKPVGHYATFKCLPLSNLKENNIWLVFNYMYIHISFLQLSKTKNISSDKDVSNMEIKYI